MFVVVAHYYANEGKEQEIVAILRRMAAFSNSDAEPGCALYAVNQSLDDPRRFLLYEQYIDEAGFQAHTETAEFKANILGKVVPMLQSRERFYYSLVPPE